MCAGFFFGMRRSIERAAHHAEGGLLFNPASGRIIGQEGDLFERMQQAVRARPIFRDESNKDLSPYE